MKSCISLYSYWKLVIAKKMTHYQVIDTIKSLGIDAVELQIFDPAVPKDMTMGEYAKTLCNYAREKGLEVPIFTVDSKIYCDDPEKINDLFAMKIDTILTNNYVAVSAAAQVK